MVYRKEKRNRKYFGTRRWGMGNIKNARGKGDRGGVGKGGKKHKFTYVTAKTPELIGKKRGFFSINKKNYKEMTLEGINRLANTGNRTEIDLPNYKVLSNGKLERGIKIKASAFSKKALEKIKSANGEAIVL